MAYNEFPVPVDDMFNDREHRRQLARSVKGLLEGKRNQMGTLTLTAASTTTTIVSDRITPDTVAILIPLSANAVAALGALYQTRAAGTLTLTHGATGATIGLDFVYILVG